MRTQARVVVIGGGIAGCSTLYHLTQEGWSDVILVERDELTSGTTWHSAAQVTQFGANQVMLGLKQHSQRLYAELAADPAYPINYHITGGVRLAHSADHMDGYKHFVSLARGMGTEFELLDAEETGRRHPLITTEGLLGSLWDPLDGDIDPAQLCQALARRARLAGAEIQRFNPVNGISRKSNGEWIVHSQNGDIVCEKVVNAGGYRVNEVGAMLGIEHPVMSMEHQYFLTEAIPQLQEMDKRVPIIRCPGDDFYSRQEKHGLLVGIYEQGCKTWGMDGIDPNFTKALCPNDMDRLLDNMDDVFARLPCLAETGITRMVNGPITYSPDGLPLVGKIPGLANAYCNIGLRAGVGEGGGHGKILAEIIVHGQSEWDSWALDPRRFTQGYNAEYCALKAIEDYQNEFRFHMPHEFRPAGRPLKSSPLFEALKAEGAEFGTVSGWERLLYIKPGADYAHKPSFRRTDLDDIVRDECLHVRDHVGLSEVTGFNRLEVKGAGAALWLDQLTCSRLPQEIGRIGLGYFLNEHGTIAMEATITKLGEDHYWLGTAAAGEFHDLDYLSGHERPAAVAITSLTHSHTILLLAGPKSRQMLQQAAPRTDWASEAFPWLSARQVKIGHAGALAMAVSYSGELAFELHIPNAQLLLAYRILQNAGRDFGLRHFGMLAIESMRLEKGFHHWKSELITERTPFESGLDRFVRLDKAFFGKSALLEREKAGRQKRLVTLSIERQDAAAHSGDIVLLDDQVVGTVTSAAFGHRTGTNLAMAFVNADIAGDAVLDVQILGEKAQAREIAATIYDPSGERMRG